MDTTRRLGCMHGGVPQIKALKYFRGIDWAALIAGSVPSPYIPRVSGPDDDSNFDRYPEEPVKWVTSGTDKYAEQFKNF